MPENKNNPVLLGEAGVGKTAIAEGLAQAIIDGDVPDLLIDKSGDARFSSDGGGYKISWSI